MSAGDSSVDAIVVGAGAGGGVVAKELATAGWEVLLLERGPWLKTESFGHCELRQSFTSAVNPTPFGPKFSEVRTVRPDAKTPARMVHPRDGLYGTLPACVGGGTVYYGAHAWRFHPETFHLKSFVGSVAGSNLADWPMSYDELEPYYEKSEYDLGVSGDLNPYGPPRRRPLPLPPVLENKEAEVLYPAARRLGWNPFHVPLAILSQPYRGRAACTHCAFCNGFGCEVGAKSSTLVSVIPVALSTGHCRLIPNAFVREISVDSRGTPDGVVYQVEGLSVWQKAKGRAIVLACSATETPRLLLNSKSRFFPRGIGNEHDQVGRNIENDGGQFVYGLFEDIVTDQTGPGAYFGVDDFQYRDFGSRASDGGKLAHGILTNYHTRPPLGFVQRIGSPSGVPRFGSQLKAFYRHYFLRSIWIYSTCHTYPRYENRVDVDPVVRDARGVPVSRITYRQHPRDADEMQFMADRSEQLLLEAGAHRVVKPEIVRETEYGISTHQQGSCRMGNDPKSSVTGRTGRIHGVPNVYVADGSLIPNPAGMNPSLTIQALAYWVSDHIIKGA